MLNKRNFTTLILLTILFGRYCLAASTINPFQGIWISKHGQVDITNCKDKKCKIEINTANGAFTCEIDKELTLLSEHSAVFQLSNLNEEDDREDTKPLFPINLSLSRQVITITVPPGSEDAARGYCGARGFFEDEYSNSNTPRIYKTSFNCDIAKTKIEIAICQSSELAHADTVLSKLYSQLKTEQLNHVFKQQKEWLKVRDTCSVLSDLKSCLSNKYRDRILVLQQNLLESHAIPSKSLKTDSNIPYNFDYLLYLSKLTNKNPYAIYSDPPLQNYLNASLPKNTIEKILPMAFYELGSELFFDDSLILITGGSPGLYTICEGLLILTKEHQTWLAYIDINNEYKKNIVVLCPKGIGCDPQPKPLKKWVSKLLPSMDNKKILYIPILR